MQTIQHDVQGSKITAQIHIGHDLQGKQHVLSMGHAQARPNKNVLIYYIINEPIKTNRKDPGATDYIVSRSIDEEAQHEKIYNPK